MQERFDIDPPKLNYEIMTFSKVQNANTELNDINQADNILNVFNLPSSQLRQKYLSNAKDKVWRVVKSIKILNENHLKKYLPKKYIMDPIDSSLRFLIDTTIVTLILFDVVITPFKLFVLSQDNTNNYREIVFDVLFLLEIIANCFTGYYDTTEQYLITDIRLIMLNYFKRGFIFDLIYTLPFWLIQPQLIIFRLIKLYRFPHIVTVIQHIIIVLSSFLIQNFKVKIIMKEIFSFGFNVLYILHVFSCVYIYIARQNETNNWITGNGLDFNNTLDIYISSVHMLTQTFSTTGFGDLKPYNNTEMVYMIIVQAICCGLFTYLITCVLMVMIAHLDTLSFKFKTQLNLYRWMLRYTSHLPSTTNQFLLTNTFWDKVTDAFDLHYGTRNNFEWINLFTFLRDIRPHDRKELMKSAFANVIEHFNLFFKGMSQCTQNQIILHFKTHIQNKQYTIIKENRRINRVYFIEKGTIVVLKGKRVVCQLREGNSFGLLGLIDKYSEYSYEISIDSDYSHLYSIKLEDLNRILSYDDISYRCALNQAINMSDSIQSMLNWNDISDQVRMKHNINEDDESMEIVPLVPDYKERNRDANDNIGMGISHNNESLHFNIERVGLGNNDKVNDTLNRVIIKEKELLDIEKRLNLINNQLSYLNKSLFAHQ